MSRHHWWVAQRAGDQGGGGDGGPEDEDHEDGEDRFEAAHQSSISDALTISTEERMFLDQTSIGERWSASITCSTPAAPLMTRPRDSASDRDATVISGGAPSAQLMARTSS